MFLRYFPDISGIAVGTSRISAPCRTNQTARCDCMRDVFFSMPRVRRQGCGQASIEKRLLKSNLKLC